VRDKARDLVLTTSLLAALIVAGQQPGWQDFQKTFARVISVLKKSLLSRLFKNSKCKEQKKFKVAAYLVIRKSLNFL